MVDNRRRSNVIPLFSNSASRRGVHPVVEHFMHYFEPIPVTDSHQQQQCYALRHQVYCHELGFEPRRDNGEESDSYDEYARSVMVNHAPSGQLAGCIRIICPDNDQQLLPLERLYAATEGALSIQPSTLPRDSICELSRIAISPLFRRRTADSHPGAATGVIDASAYGDLEVRCFPLLAMGLYLSAVAQCCQLKRQHAFAMMEQSLVSSVEQAGLTLEQIGEWRDYHGQRAPFLISPMAPNRHSDGLRSLQQAIEAALSG
ncbi:PEP-CTERM/exosortase system-associated acyltransferase [Aestuariibacter halophilus]|uniref:PEP-CTERM/exosortase system-associated acyltransferase n=1 Tax=Fluctibacter halophilus TaxID=226011 RepID=A0ABS8GCU0_9ALTE|nr:PEP-CTERM/exosortase system-associated acyltransferase [Aestuariibacter halophilus]MCC2618214.1 PEP-CTERM/exosortase system-associated acyltransferase [Aestuariibacter halophilus]